MSYGKVKDTFWTDDKIIGLSDAPKLLALYLLSGPHRNAIGCMRLPLGYIWEDLGWSEEGAAEALQCLSSIGFITRDEATGWTLVNNVLKHDPIKQDKAGIGAAKLAMAVPKNTKVYQLLKEKLEPQLMIALKGKKDVPGWPMPEASMALQYEPDVVPARPYEGPSKAQPSPEPSPEPLPKPEPQPQFGDTPSMGQPRGSAEVKPNPDPAVEIIALFDRVQAEVFGPQQRQMPAGDDIVFARRWREAGADLGLLGALFHARFAARKGSGADAPRSLKYLDAAVNDALRAATQTGARPQAPPPAMTPEMEAKSKRYTDAVNRWHADGMQGQMPKPEEFGLPPRVKTTAAA
jgi:hypothetical protein